jgi:type IV secretory pathway VirB10-like protein
MKILEWGIARKYLLAVLMLASVAFCLIGLKLFFWSEVEGDIDSSADGLTPRNVQGQVGGEGSAEYNQMIEELNRAGAALALETGESFVATPVGSPKTIAPKTQESPKTSINKDKDIKPPQMAPQPLQQNIQGPYNPPLPAVPAGPDPAIEAIVGDLKSLSPSSPGAIVITQAKDIDLGELDSPISTGLSAPLPEPGSILYAVTEVGLNSDIPSPISALVVQGPFKGARLLGGFELQNTSLSITFDRLIPQGKLPIEIEALAVDPQTNSPSISGKVDRHFLERWGGLMAASFLEGFGEAMGNRGTTVHAYGDVVVADRGAVSLDDVSLEALGRVGSRAATQLEKGFDRPPTVTIPAGSPMGILVLGTKH